MKYGGDLLKYRIMLERLTFAFATLFVAVAIFAFLAFLCKETLHWVLFPALGESFFNHFLPLLALGIFVLVMFNITLNVSLISQALLEEKQMMPPGKEMLKKNAAVVAILFLFLAMTFTSLYFVNKRNVKVKMHEIRKEMTSLKEQNRKLIGTIADNFSKRQNPGEIIQALEALSSTSPYFRNLKIVYPVRVQERLVFLSYGKYWNEKHQTDFFDIAEGPGNVLSPNRFELDYLVKATEDESASTGDGVFVQRPYFNIYSPVKDEQNRTIFFLFSDDHQYGVKEYK